MKRSNQTGFALFPLIMLCLLLIGVLGVFSLVLRQHEQPESSTSATPPLFSFAAAGDFSSTKETGDVLKLISKQNTDFALALGDLSYSSTPTEKDWCSFVTSKVGKDYPFLLIAGNHDVDNGAPGEYIDSIQKYADCLPGSIKGVTGTYAQQYYFDYKSKVRFIGVSPNLTIGSKKYEYKNGDAGYQWVSDAIADAKNKQIPWTVVFMHKNCISVGEKTCEIGTDLFNLLIKKKVTLILQGHDHTYQRSKPLKLSNSCPEIIYGVSNQDCVSNVGDTYDTYAGTTVIINGTGGKELYAINGKDDDSVYFRQTNGLNKDPVHGSVFVEVYGNRLNVLYKSTSGRTVDSFTINNQ